MDYIPGVSVQGYTTEGTVFYWNKASEKVYGYTAKEAIGKNLGDLIIPSNLKSLFRKCLESAKKIRKSGEFMPPGELLLLHKKGHLVPVYSIHTAILNKDRKPLLFCIDVDLSERKKAEEALRESEYKFRSLFNQAADLIAIVDIHGNFLDLNKQFEDESGWKREEMIGKNLFKCGIITEESAEKVSFHLSELLLGKEPPIFEIDGVRKDGEIVPYEIKASSIIKDDRIIAVQAILRNIVERKHAQEKIIYMAYYDSLTNLPNRYLLKDRLKQAIASARQHKRIVAVMFLDLDNFKRINDTLGHETGDQLLKGVADRLMKYIRRSDTIALLGENALEDTVARMWGDEFTILLTEISYIPDAARVANRVVNLFSQPFRVKGRDLFVGPSIGISIYPHNGDDVDTLLKNADTAMYHAKDQGRKNFQFYTESMNTYTLDRLSLESDLRKALDADGFQLHYQPQIDLHSRTICGVEALIRWMHPDRGLLSPSAFIPLAEEMGIILPIGEWILHTACAQNKAWQTAGFRPMRVTVNISGIQFSQSNFVETVTKILKDVQLEAGYLELELTETIFMESTEMAISRLKQLKALGIWISIDDFGTGYSSLSYLKRFPIDTLKIDRSFVSDIQEDPADKAIVNSIIALAHNLNLTVVAEGVEKREQLEFLRVKGCDRIQGYLFGPAMPGDSLAQLLKEEEKLLGYL